MLLGVYYASVLVVFAVIYPLKQKLVANQKLSNFFDKALGILVWYFIITVTMFCYFEMLILGILAFQKNTQEWGFADILPEYQNNPLLVKEDRANDPAYYTAHDLEHLKLSFTASPLVSGDRDADYNPDRRRLVTIAQLTEYAYENGRSGEAESAYDDSSPNGGSLFVGIYYLCSTMLLLPMVLAYVFSRPLEKHSDKKFMSRWGAALF